VPNLLVCDDARPTSRCFRSRENTTILLGSLSGLSRDGGARGARDSRFLSPSPLAQLCRCLRSRKLFRRALTQTAVPSRSLHSLVVHTLALKAFFTASRLLRSRTANAARVHTTTQRQ
jgi:hypothetical protein